MGSSLTLPRYSWRHYLERMRLWYRLIDLNVDQIRSQIAGRLAGRPYTLAMKLSVRSQDGQIFHGDEALTYLGTDPIMDGMEVTQAAAASGTVLHQFDSEDYYTFYWDDNHDE